MVERNDQEAPSAPQHSPLEERVGRSLTRIARLAARLLHASAGVVYFGRPRSGWLRLRSWYGDAGEWSPLDIATLAALLSTKDLQVFPDTALVRDSPVSVTLARRRVRFCASAAVKDEKGENAGVLYLLDRRPLKPRPPQIAALTDLAAVASEEVWLWNALVAFTENSEGLSSSGRRTPELFESSSNLFYTHDLSGRMLSANGAAERITGYSRSELVDMHISEVFAPESREEARQMVLELCGGGLPAARRLKLRHQSGVETEVEVSVCLLFEHGLPRGVLGLVREAASPIGRGADESGQSR